MLHVVVIPSTREGGAEYVRDLMRPRDHILLTPLPGRRLEVEDPLRRPAVVCLPDVVYRFDRVTLQRIEIELQRVGAGGAGGRVVEDQRPQRVEHLRAHVIRVGEVSPRRRLPPEEARVVPGPVVRLERERLPRAHARLRRQVVDVLLVVLARILLAVIGGGRAPPSRSGGDRGAHGLEPMQLCLIAVVALVARPDGAHAGKEVDVAVHLPLRPVQLLQLVHPLADRRFPVRLPGEVAASNVNGRRLWHGEGSELCDDPWELSAAPPGGPEHVRVLVGVRHEQGALVVHILDGDQPVAAPPLVLSDGAPPTAEQEPCGAHVALHPQRERPVERGELHVHLPVRVTAPPPRDLRVGVVAELQQVGDVDDELPSARVVLEAVRAGAHRDLHLVVPRALHRHLHVGHRLHAHDRERRGGEVRHGVEALRGGGEVGGGGEDEGGGGGEGLLQALLQALRGVGEGEQEEGEHGSGEMGVLTRRDWQSLAMSEAHHGGTGGVLICGGERNGLGLDAIGIDERSRDRMRTVET